MVTARRNESIVRIEPTNMFVGPSCSPGDRRCHQRPMRNPKSDIMIAAIMNPTNTRVTGIGSSSCENPVISCDL